MNDNSPRTVPASPPADRAGETAHGVEATHNRPAPASGVSQPTVPAARSSSAGTDVPQFIGDYAV